MINRRRPVRGAVRSRGLAIAALLLFVGSFWPEPGAVGASAARMVAGIDGRALSKGPIQLHSDRPTEVRIDLTNAGTTPLVVRDVRLEGRVLGLTFFSFDTAVDIRVAPGATMSRKFALDLRDLHGQATGLMPGSVKLLDDRRHEVLAQDFTADVQGSMTSVYGFFGFAAMVLTALTFAGVLLALARQRLPANRALRGLRFAVAGFGFGVAAVFVLSVLRVMVPSASRWLPTLLITTGVAFGLGYLTPTPDDLGPQTSGEGDPELDEEFLESVSDRDMVRPPSPPG